MQSLPPQYYAPYANTAAHYQTPPPPHMMHHQQQMAMNMSQLPPQQSAQPELNANGKPKRKQVKNACVNCQKACKKCDDGRPCSRCVKYGLTETCVDSVRKERKKGVKRGPYKRRNQANSSASASPTPAAAVAATNNTMYGQAPGVSANMRQPMPFNYPNFPQYDSFNGASGYPTYGYNNMMPPVYQHNPSMVNYPGMMVQPNQPQQQHHDVMNNSRPVSRSPHQYQQQQQQHQQQASAETNSQSNDAGEDEDGNKLSILSQLCSAVLDNTDAPKQEAIEDKESQEAKRQQDSNRFLPVHNGTPPPSRGHSRTSSFEHTEYHAPSNTSASFGHDSPHTYINGQLRANIYGTPNSSPSNSPINSNFNKPAASGAWPLPSLQSVVSPQQQQQQPNNWQGNW